jgi:hypothetical protein
MEENSQVYSLLTLSSRGITFPYLLYRKLDIPLPLTYSEERATISVWNLTPIIIEEFQMLYRCLNHIHMTVLL